MIENPRSTEPPHIPRSITGSDDADFSDTLLADVLTAQYHDAASEKQVKALFAAMAGMKPQDELEGMLCGLLIASYQTAMQCYQHAAIPEQTFEGKRENLNQANKLSRTFAALTEALDRHRGKGQQHVKVEHVHVHQGGRAIVGAVTPGEGSSRKLEEQTHAPRGITHEPGTPMWSPDPERQTMPIASGARKAPM